VSTTVGLAIIALNEEESLPRLLASIEGAFDRVVLLDTGSEDATVDVFSEWAEAEQLKSEDFTYGVDRFAWIDDFGAARRAADDLLMEEPLDWTCWADCDDVVIGAGNLRRVAAEAAPEVSAFYFDYDYGRDEAGNCLSLLRRERLVRAGKGRWRDRIHEAQEVDGAIQFVSPDIAVWRHEKPLEQLGNSGPRNLRILEKWLDEEPENSRVLAYVGTEKMALHDFDAALPYFERYLALRHTWDEERAQIIRKAAVCLMATNRPAQAASLALEAVELVPTWPDSYLSLAESALLRKQWQKAAHWAKEVLRLGPPSTLLIINPLEYRFLPLKVIAFAAAGDGQMEAAVTRGTEALRIVGDPTLAEAVAGWRAELKRDQTAGTFAMCAQILIAHDEQLKARTLLRECVPYYAQDHPKIIALRTDLHARIGWMDASDEYALHYEVGGSKPEDFLPLPLADEVAASLPRVGFLINGLLEQAEAA
jgi:tetratricopeptide (TPR) repeat protein